MSNLAGYFSRSAQGDCSPTMWMQWAGQAVAHMTLQAQALGLAARQFRAFSRTGVAAEFAVPGHWEVTTMMAIGRAALAGAPGPAPARAGTPARQRRSVEDILWPAG